MSYYCCFLFGYDFLFGLSIDFVGVCILVVVGLMKI